MSFKVKNRFQAFAVHIAISICIFLVFLSAMLIWWYPSPYFEAEGGWGVIYILVGVDIILGPSLTFLVFKRGKPSLKFDLSVIACIQLAALLYGGQIIYQQRPVFLVFAEDRFVLVSTNDVDMSLVDKSILKQKANGPLPVYAKMPDSVEERRELVIGMFMGKPDFAMRAEYYEPMLPHLQGILAADKGIDIYKEQSDSRQLVASFLESHNDKLNEYAYFPLVGRNKDMLLVMNKRTGGVIGALAVNPWLKPN